MANERTDPQRGIGGLLRELADGSVELLRQEIRLARIELASLGRSLATGTALVAFGGVLALVGTFALLTGIILLSGDQWLRDQYWLAALIVFVIAGALAAWLAARGRARLDPRHLAPTETVATLKEIPHVRNHG